MNILVTGGAGYIGSHACKALAAKGYMPITYDNLSRGNRWAVKWGPLEQGDIADENKVRAVLERYRPAALMHFAAYAYIGESVEQPLLYYENNVAGTASLLKSIVGFQIIPVVFSSTCATYGVPERVPITEDQPKHPINPYGHSKLFVERMLADLNVACGLPWMALRYFNAAGADPNGEIGEAHDPETHLIPLVLAAARSGSPVKVFGNDYDTPDGSCVRDYIHVSDIADAHVRALEYLLNGGQSCALNLANARGYSVMEVIAAAETICGHRIPWEPNARRPGDPAVLIGMPAARKRCWVGSRHVQNCRCRLQMRGGGCRGEFKKDRINIPGRDRLARSRPRPAPRRVGCRCYPKLQRRANPEADEAEVWDMLRLAGAEGIVRMCQAG